MDLPAGVEDGQRLRACPGRREGQGPGRARARGQPHRRGRCGGPAFRLRGADLVTKVELSFPDAALGGTAKAPTLDGEVEVKVPKSTSQGIS